jgi:hypothetical protein
MIFKRVVYDLGLNWSWDEGIGLLISPHLNISILIHY